MTNIFAAFTSRGLGRISAHVLHARRSSGGRHGSVYLQVASADSLGNTSKILPLTLKPCAAVHCFSVHMELTQHHTRLLITLALHRTSTVLCCTAYHPMQHHWAVLHWIAQLATATCILDCAAWLTVYACTNICRLHFSPVLHLPFQCCTWPPVAALSARRCGTALSMLHTIRYSKAPCCATCPAVRTALPGLRSSHRGLLDLLAQRS